LVLLANREVFAAGGHPHETDDHPQSSQPRENNNTPEIFSLGTKSWRLLNGDITAPDEVVTDNYPRFRLLPSGLLFTDTEGNRGTRRLFNPVSGRWEGPNVDVSALPSDYKVGSNETSVLLPLLPPNYPVRVLACNSAHPTAFRVDVDETPRWFPTARRQGIPGKKPGEGRKPPASMTVRRANACAVLLPTGQVFLTGGVIPSGDEHVANTPVYEPELYTPGIDFVKGAFRGADSWETLADPSPVPRGYHATALLLPDGRVWTAGSQEGFAWYELRVAIYSPWYVGRNRAQILDVVGLTRLPNGKRPALLPGAVAFIRYGATFEITVSRPIARVALMRCGAVTHAFDSEQRYVGLKFTRRGSKRRPRFTVTAPPNGNVAPPGYYMLWVVNSQGVPCERAAFVLLVASTLRKPRPPRRKPKRPPFPRGPKKRSPKKKPPPKRPRRKR
jgi:hypothetical protein